MKSDTTICLNFCRYYKPGKNEELACRGYLVLREIIQSGKKISQERPAKLVEADAKTLAHIKQYVCEKCAFLPDGCDFMLTSNASPCGGFVLLSHLIGIGELTRSDLDRHEATG